ncbi:MAG: hypothetical protein WC521_06115, partial [Bdellovibrionales bacterium]
MNIAEDTSNSQTGKKLEKSLDAIAALRKAMEERLAESKAAQEAKAAQESKKKQEPQAEPEVAPPEPRDLPADESADLARRSVAKAEGPSFAQEMEERLAKAEAEVQKAKAEAEAQKAKAEAEVQKAKAEAEAAVKEEARKAKKEAAAKEEALKAKEKEEAKTKPEPSPQKEGETPMPAKIPFDMVEWTQIMMHVAKECQKQIRDYIVRTRDKPIDTLSISPTPMLDSLSQLTSRYFDNPEAYTDAQLATWQNYIDLTRATLMRLQGQAPEQVAETTPEDKRFKAKDWQTNWMFDFLKQAYLSTADEMQRLVRQETTHVQDKMSKKLEFYSRLFLDASAPNNFWMTNPEVLRVTLETKGENLIKGFENLLRDLESGNGLLRIRMSDYKAFELGRNIATAPGKVVYQNELFQLIQYAPTTETVHRVPFLIIPPWINKYYILDLREKNSFVQYLVKQGHTVFCISWVNPGKRHALTQFEDYMEIGALTALREVKRFTGENEVNVLGYCIGGTLLACTQAYLAKLPEKPADLPTIKSSTYLVTMIDFSQPGDLGVSSTK